MKNAVNRINITFTDIAITIIKGKRYVFLHIAFVFYVREIIFCVFQHKILIFIKKYKILLIFLKIFIGATEIAPNLYYFNNDIFRFRQIFEVRNRLKKIRMSEMP